MEVGPFRSLDEYLTSESKFEMPEFNNPEKVSQKIVSNLLYYQTNYFASALIIFLLVCFFSPWKTLYVLIAFAVVFGGQYYMAIHHIHVKAWKKNHPTAVMTGTFFIGGFLMYQFGWFRIFLFAVLTPLLLVALHAFLHVKGKTLITKGPFWKKKKEIEFEPTEVTNVSDVQGVSRKSPMGRLLAEFGIPPEFKCIS